MRDRHDAIRDLGARCVAIGTGDRRYARDFAERERIPFPILVDDDGAAARAASVERVGMRRLFSPASFPGTLGALRRGYFVGRPGKRVDQLGATFVVTPGDRVAYQHYDAHPADHAPLRDVLAAVARCVGAELVV